MTTLDTKQELESLLPFYLNGSLDDIDKARIEKALAEDEDLRQELAFAKIMQKQIQQVPEQSPAEFGLKRLQRSLKQQQEKERLQLQSTEQTTSAKKGWQFIAIAASLMLFVQTVTTVQQQSDDYMAAGGGKTIQQGQIVSVTFSSTATELQIRQLLLENNAVIVDGPSALGIYHLALTSEFETSLQALQARSDLIESIQQD